MRVVIQRVLEASVRVKGKLLASTGKGLLVLVGMGHDDKHEDAEWLVKKITQLRIFNDDQGVMNLSVNDVDGEVMVISQFTLHAKVKKGNRPSYIKAARPETAIPLYEKFIRTISTYVEHKIQTGEFGAVMQVSLTNDGPVTIIIDTKNKE